MRQTEKRITVKVQVTREGLADILEVLSNLPPNVVENYSVDFETAVPRYAQNRKLNGQKKVSYRLQVLEALRESGPLTLPQINKMLPQIPYKTLGTTMWQLTQRDEVHADKSVYPIVYSFKSEVPKPKKVRRQFPVKSGTLPDVILSAVKSAGSTSIDDLRDVVKEAIGPKAVKNFATALKSLHRKELVRIHKDTVEVI